MDNLEGRIEAAQALSRVMASSAHLMLAMGMEAEPWSTEWAQGTVSDALDTVNHRMNTAVGYIEENKS